ncbi:hypothetical protein L596_006025 [Steinernema carpocapsae]|uniref:Uncharacterized protein n=1 Tax=Steinernema carpocapsae TaxID=34508 RepID=A0A4U8V2B2_STECR|nr:hypothetical protein L596_006025 [Steinernema carpocapsae]
MITFEMQQLLVRLRSLLVRGESWKTEETLLDEVTFVHVWDLKSGRGFKRKEFSAQKLSDPKEYWFV